MRNTVEPIEIKPEDVARTLGEFVLSKLSQKSLQFLMFVPHVLDHLEHYVVPQYGDLPDKMIDDFDINDIRAQLVRYSGRSGKSARGKAEDHRDMCKLAHYACYQKHKLECRDGGDQIVYPQELITDNEDED